MRNIHLTPQLVQAVREATDIVSVASEHTRLARRGGRWVGICPIHKEKTPSFSVDADQGLFYCFGCGAGGDAIKLHMLTTGDDFPAAIEALAFKFGVSLPAAATAERGSSNAERGRERALAAAQEFFRKSLERSAVAQGYLEGRRVPPELVERFGLGYAPEGWRELLTALEGKVPLADLEAAGLATRGERAERPYDRFRHRLMFPIHGPTGRLVGFGGRTLGDDRAKYINTAETAEFHKSRLLYGLHLAKRAARESGRLLLVEGYFDVVAAVAAGVEATVASMGTALTQEQSQLLARYCDEVIVGYDGDSAGETAARRALPILTVAKLSVRRARFGEGEDPDSLRLSAGPEAVALAVAQAQDLVESEIERLASEGAASPHTQARAASAVAELLAAIPDSIVRLGYGRMAAARLGVPLSLLRQRMTSGVRREEPPRAPEAAKPAIASEARLVPSAEERVLQLLLSGQAAVPPLEVLPPAEVFWEEDCRNIFLAFCTLYRENQGGVVSGRDLAQAVEGDAELARLGRIVLESPVTPGSEDLSDLLDHLSHRWRQKRIEDLSREIAAAERRGDGEHLAQLLQEKTNLSKRHHAGRGRPGTAGRATLS